MHGWHVHQLILRTGTSVRPELEGVSDPVRTSCPRLHAVADDPGHPAHELMPAHAIRDIRRVS